MTLFDAGTALRTLIEEDAGIAEYVGKRIYPAVLPVETDYEVGSGDLPAMTYMLIDCVEMDEAPISTAHWQITCFAKEQRILNAIAGRVKGLLHGYKGGPIRYAGITDAEMLYDEETKTPYCPMTFQVKFFDEEE